MAHSLIEPIRQDGKTIFKQMVADSPLRDIDGVAVLLEPVRGVPLMAIPVGRPADESKMAIYASEIARRYYASGGKVESFAVDTENFGVGAANEGRLVAGFAGYCTPDEAERLAGWLATAVHAASETYVASLPKPSSKEDAEEGDDW